MNTIPFVGLHAHSVAGSIFDGMGYPPDHMDFAYSNGMDALALTDHGNMNGLSWQVLHAKKMKKEGKECNCIRCKEIGDDMSHLKSVSLTVRKYGYRSCPCATFSIVAEMRMDLAREISEPCPQPLASAAESLAPPAARPSPTTPKTPQTPSKNPR